MCNQDSDILSLGIGHGGCVFVDSIHLSRSET